MKPKHLLILSIVAGLVAVVLVQIQLRKEKGSPVVVFRATKALKAGETIGDGFERVTLPGENLFPNLLKEAPTGEMEEFVATTALREPIRAGEIVLFRHLESTVDPGVRARIPPGMKAVSLLVDEASSVSYLVQPGDFVDVLAALPRNAAGQPSPQLLTGLMTAGAATGALGSPGGTLESRVLLQAVEVLAVGRRSRRSEAALRGQDAYTAVTLLASMEEAQKLTYARDVLESPMTLVLRSPEDGERETSTKPLSLASPQFERIGNQ